MKTSERRDKLWCTLHKPIEGILPCGKWEKIAGKAVADSYTTDGTNLQKQIIRDCLAGANGRTRVESWLPRWMAFPPQSYTERAGFRPADDWSRVAQLFG